MCWQWTFHAPTTPQGDRVRRSNEVGEYIQSPICVANQSLTASHAASTKAQRRAGRPLLRRPFWAGGHATCTPGRLQEPRPPPNRLRTRLPRPVGCAFIQSGQGRRRHTPILTAGVSAAADGRSTVLSLGDCCCHQAAAGRLRALPQSPAGCAAAPLRRLLRRQGAAQHRSCDAGTAATSTCYWAGMDERVCASSPR